jgi:FkbM family methyltransferase
MKERSRQPGLVKHVVERRLWGSSPFFLLDVGCSRGIENRWHHFGDNLRAIGFDPLVAEIDRLNSLNTYSGVTYVAAFVVCRQFDSLFPLELRRDWIRSKNDDPFSRVSATAVSETSEVSYVQERYNTGAPVVMTDRTVELDEVIEPQDRSRVDFLKIDTDGHDIEVLLGAKALLASGSLLGVKIEVQFHGAIHPCANTFGNIDGLLRQQGFSLFDLTTFRYSRKHLPAPFLYNQPAQTTTGQTIQADAVYFRDLGAPHYERMWAYEVTPERVLKLACLFDSFDLPDCSAELLVSRGGFLRPDVREHLLDLLVTGEPGSYAKHMALFEDDYEALYPRRMNSSAPEPDPKTNKQVRHLRKRLVTLRKKNALLRERLRARDERIDRLTRQGESSRD